MGEVIPFRKNLVGPADAAQAIGDKHRANSRTSRVPGLSDRSGLGFMASYRAVLSSETGPPCLLPCLLA